MTPLRLSLVALFSFFFLGVYANAKREVQGSLRCKTVFIPGQINDLTFELTVSSPDFEYVDSIWVALPAGSEIIDTIADEISQQGSKAEKFRIESFFNDTAYWGNGNNLIGGLKSGVYEFTLQVDIPASVTETQELSFFLKGDAGIQGTTDPKNLRGKYFLISNQDVPDIGIKVSLSHPYRVENYNANTSPVLETQVSVDDKPMLESAEVNVLVNDIPFTQNFVDKSHLLPIDSISNTTIVLAADSFSIPSQRIVKARASYHNPVDPNQENNADSVFLRFTPFSQSYNDGFVADSAYGFAGASGKVGQVFLLNEILTKVIAYFESPEDSTRVRAAVYAFENNQVGGRLALSDFEWVSKAQEEVEFPLSRPLSGLENQLVLLVLEQYDPVDMGLGLVKENFQNNYNWIETGTGWQLASEVFPEWQYNFKITAFSGLERDTTYLPDYAPQLDKNQMGYAVMPADYANFALTSATAYVSNLGQDGKLEASLTLSINSCQGLQAVQVNENQTDTLSADVSCSLVEGEQTLYATTQSDEDEFAHNNQDSLSFTIAADRLSYAYSNQLGTFEIGEGAASPYVTVTTHIYPASVYENVTDSIFAVSLLGDFEPGDTLWVEIYPALANGNPDITDTNQLAVSQKIEVADTLPFPKLIFDEAFSDTGNNGFAVVVKIISNQPRLAHFNSGISGKQFLVGSGNSITALPEIMGVPAISLWLAPVTNTSVRALSKGLKVSVFPNPTSGDLYVRGERIQYVRVMSVMGKSITSVQVFGRNEVEIDTQNWKPGVYVLQTYSNGKWASTSVVKQ